MLDVKKFLCTPVGLLPFLSRLSCFYFYIFYFLSPRRYAANIEKIDYEDEKVLIHYRQWSHRYDEWFDWTSPYLRPVERIQLRRQGLQDDAPVPVRAVFITAFACVAFREPRPGMEVFIDLFL